MLWSPEAEQTFSLLKQALLSAPALSLPTVNGFHLYVTETNKQKGMALGVLTQPRGPSQQPVGYLSMELDLVACGWPTCLWALVMTAFLVPKATKLTVSQD